MSISIAPAAAATAQPAVPSFDFLPDSGMIRASHLVRDIKHPNRPVPLQISLSTLWRYVAAGTFPKPIKLSAGIVAWRVGDVRAWMDARRTEALALAA